MRFSSLVRPAAATVLAVVGHFSPPLWAQIQPPVPPVDPEPYPVPDCPQVVAAYVDVATGVDPLPPYNFPYTSILQRLNNPTKPFRTLQLAIDACQLGVINVYTNPSIPESLNARGVVYCMPGLYGPAGTQAGPKDTLPINMKDRVSVQGQGARRTVLRGIGVPNKTPFWPVGPTCGQSVWNPNAQPLPREVLVDFSFSNPSFNVISGQTVPWNGTGDSEEMIDAFSFEQGDVQVFAELETPTRGRISNCIFDLRKDPAMDPGGTLGPFFGIEMVRTWDAHIPPLGGYRDNLMNILNNTFVLGERAAAPTTSLLARSDAVAVIDVNDPVCNPFPPPTGDTNQALRGVGKPSLQNNLVRSLPEQTATMEFLGIDSTDATASIGSSPGTTNAFRQSRAGGTNTVFHSAIVGTAPTAAVNLDTLSNDPAFIGEAVAPQLTSFKSYRDWRLLPGSPVTGMGSAPVMSGGSVRLVATNGTTYSEPYCPQTSSFDWDGEMYGNPRRIVEVDIGFDEIDVMIMAGTYANDSNSHNTPDLVIDPNTTTTGAVRRFLIFPAAAAGTSMLVHGTNLPYVYAPPTPIPAWINPPGSIYPWQITATLEPFHQARYIPFTDPNPPTPWSGNITPSSLTDPVSGVGYPIGLRLQSDNEGTGPAKYFNTQSVLNYSGFTWYSNLQAEYR